MSKVYYNEFDPFAAAWLRELIKEGLIVDGDVDERSITEVRPDEIKGYTQCHFFAGIGGWSAALRLAGWADSRSVWTGSCPCQPFSVAGTHSRQSDERNLWPAWRRLIAECHPSTIFGEQVASAIAAGWWDDVATDLEAEGYACAAAVLPACSVGSPHKRDRLWFVGHSGREGLQGFERDECAQDRWEEQGRGSIPSPSFWRGGNTVECKDGKRRPVEPSIHILTDGIPNRVGKLRGYGNAIVPQVAAAFIQGSM